MTISITAGGKDTSGDVVFYMDGIPVAYTCPSGTKWSTLDAQSVLGYRLYDAYGLVSPLQGGTGPFVIDESTQDPVGWTDTIKNNGRYYISG